MIHCVSGAASWLRALVACRLPSTSLRPLFVPLLSCHRPLRHASRASRVLSQPWNPDNNVPASLEQKVGRNLHRLRDHPVEVVKRRIFTHFEEKYKTPQGTPRFVTLDDLDPVVPVYKNFDSLLTPKDHVSRGREDTYYVDRDTVLRTQCTAHQDELLRRGIRAFLVAGDVYRRDKIDASHYPVFHQCDGVRVFDANELAALQQHDVRQTEVDVVIHDLKSVLEGLVRALFGDRVADVRWVDTTFPFTDPSLELEILFQGDWMEVLGCGVMRQEIITNSGMPSHQGWAFGIGLERLAMALFAVDDIRLFWTDDERFHTQFHGIGDKIIQYQPFSRYPPCGRDVSFWIPSSSSFHTNSFCELVRTIAGDLVEDVSFLDEYRHPTTGRLSLCYHITYRAMSRTMTAEEVNSIQDRVRKALVDEMGVELR